MSKQFETPFVFFGTSRFSVILLEELKAVSGIVPDLIITAPDRPVGRKQIITPPPVKDWAIENDVATFQPESLRNNTEELIEELKNYSLFIVASYGKIIPKEILDIPTEHGTLNVHPSLLPKYRGASPIQSQILNDEKNVGTTIILMDEEMDHGDIIAQKEISFTTEEFPAPYNNVEEKLAKESAVLLADTLPKWISKEISATPQNHDTATFTKIIKKEDGEITISIGAGDANPVASRKNYLKYLAYSEWPKTFFFFEKEGKKKRAIVTEATFEAGEFIIKKVIPEGRDEMSFEAFLKYQTNAS
jgi:methionyl-tRNA formyltransferase